MENDGIFLFLLLFLILGIGFIANLLIKEENAALKETCIMHKWEYKEAEPGSEYMICTICNKLPGDREELNNEEPY